MRNFLNDSAIALKQGGIRAFFDKAAGYKDTINLGIGEPDLDTPHDITEAAYRSAMEGFTHYTANAGLIGLRKEISKYLSEYGVDADPEKEIIVTPGGMGALSLTLLCTVSEGVDVLVQDPQWLNYISQIRFMGGNPVRIPVYEENGYVLTAEDIEKAITPATKVLLINSPNNPTGAVIDHDMLVSIAKIAIEKDLLVVSDEVYCELLYDGRKHESIAALPGMKERTVIVNSFSKSFAMTGWRIGFAAGPEQIIKKLVYLQENMSACANSFSQMGAAYALQSRSQLTEMREKYENRRDLMCEGLRKLSKVSFVVPKGAFYIFLNIKMTGLTSMEAAERLLTETGVVTVPGSAFGEMGEGYLRLSYANSEENLREALVRMEKVLG